MASNEKLETDCTMNSSATVNSDTSDTVTYSYPYPDTTDIKYTYTDGVGLQPHSTSLYPLYLIPHAPVYIYAPYHGYSCNSYGLYQTFNSDLNCTQDSTEDGLTDDSDTAQIVDSTLLNETTDHTPETTDESDNLEGSESEEKPASITSRPWDWVQSPEFVPNNFNLQTSSLTLQTSINLQTDNLDPLDDDNDIGSTLSSDESVDTNGHQTGELLLNAISPSDSIINPVPIIPTYYQHYMPSTSYSDITKRGGNTYSEQQNCWMYSNIPRQQYTPHSSGYLQCDQCMEYCLDPKDDDLNKLHRKDCSDRIEKDMEEAFALQRSEGKICSICYEEVIKKPTYTESRFGLLLGCLHVFCLSCIRKWRTNNGGDKNAVRSCPLCRTHSDYVIPSIYWVDEDESKAKLIHQYQIKLSRISCRYFNGGKGNCPFGNNCFYMHDVIESSRPLKEKFKKYKNSDGNIRVMTSLRLSDFLEYRESRSVS